jgi:hypothetical protein
MTNVLTTIKTKHETRRGEGRAPLSKRRDGELDVVPKILFFKDTDKDPLYPTCPSRQVLNRLLHNSGMVVTLI